ncbi:MAG: TrkA family potassium uptake protein [Oscillospiraceae bacterium]|nr:TrkA family potassium uptake protein [Oscillospiraceae bacterium]
MGSFLVIGMGRFGRSVATELFQMRHDVLAVDEREENISGIVDQVTDVIIGDAKDEAVLRSLEVQNFDCVVVAMAGVVEDSVLTTIMLKEMGAKQIVCKSQNEWHAKILSQLGADRVVRPEWDMGKRVAHSLAKKNIVDYLEISPEYGVIEMITPAHWADKSIVDSSLRRKYGITVIAIRDAKTAKVKFSPQAETVLGRDDILTIIGAKKDLDRIGELK